MSFYLDRRRAKSDGAYPVKLRVCGRLFATGVDVAEGAWDGRAVTRRDAGWREKNARLSILSAAAERAILRAYAEGRVPSADDVAPLLPGRVPRLTVASYMDGLAARRTGMTRKAYEYTARKVRDFGDLPPSRVDRSWLERFDGWMRAGGLSPNSRWLHLKNVRAAFNGMMDDGLPVPYPFRRFRLPQERTRKRSLGAEGVAALIAAELPRRLERHRDYFILMFCLLGINGADLSRLEAVEGGRVEYRRSKTGRLFSVRVEPEAAEIMGRHAGKRLLLDIADRYGDYRNFMVALNKGLAEIADAAGLPRFTSYWSRHTWASVAASLEIPKETISAALGHSSGAAVTDIYIDFDRRKVDEANRRVLDHVALLAARAREKGGG